MLPCKNNNYYLFWVYVCSFSYPARKAHAPYYIVICGLSGCTIVFSFISQMAPFSGRGGCYWTYNACFDFLYTFCLKHFSYYEEMSEMWSKMFFSHHVKNLNFLDRYSKNTQISNFMKIRPVGTELFHADGRTDGLRETQTQRS